MSSELTDLPNAHILVQYCGPYTVYSEVGGLFSCTASEEKPGGVY